MALCCKHIICQRFITNKCFHKNKHICWMAQPSWAKPWYFYWLVPDIAINDNSKCFKWMSMISAWLNCSLYGRNVWYLLVIEWASSFPLMSPHQCWLSYSTNFCHKWHNDRSCPWIKVITKVTHPKKVEWVETLPNIICCKGMVKPRPFSRNYFDTIWLVEIFIPKTLIMYEFGEPRPNRLLGI